MVLADSDAGVVYEPEKSNGAVEPDKTIGTDLSDGGGGKEASGSPSDTSGTQCDGGFVDLTGRGKEHQQGISPMQGKCRKEGLH